MDLQRQLRQALFSRGEEFLWAVVLTNQPQHCKICPESLKPKSILYPLPQPAISSPLQAGTSAYNIPIDNVNEQMGRYLYLKLNFSLA